MNLQRIAILLLTTLLIELPVRASEKSATIELLIKWQGGPQGEPAAFGNAQLGSTVIRNFPAVGWQLVELPRGMSVRDGLAAYQALGTVLTVEANGIIKPTPTPMERAGRSAPDEGDAAIPVDGPGRTPRPAVGLHGPPPPVIPSDAMFGQQWYLNRIGATNAWARTTGSTKVVVAIIDSGINYNHEDLAANMWRNPGETGLDANGMDKATNGIDDDANGYGDDIYGIDITGDGLHGDSDPFDEGVEASPGVRIYHGTACAGVIGAVGNNAKGVAGINWTVQLMAIRTGGPNNVAYISQFVEAFNCIVAMKRSGVNVRVTSNSYFTDPLGGYSQALKDSIDLAGTEGILTIVAANNFGSDLDRYPSYPAAYDCPSIISIANSDANDQLRPSSNYGRTGVDLAAPGVGITTTSDANNYYSSFSGTSAAAPMVAGAAALLLAAEPNATVSELKGALLGSVDQTPALKGKVVTNGRLNVARAMEFISSTTNPPIVISALPGGQRTDPSAPVQVIFNRKMNRATVESAFLITPDVRGRFDWADDGRSFFFRHDVPFDKTTDYTVRILGTALDDAGEMLDGNFNRSRDGSPADDFVWTFGFPLANDDFLNAQSLSGPSGTAMGSNRYASVEPHEPFHVVGEFGTSWNSLWYRWTAPVSGGWFTFDLTGSTAFDTLLAVYIGEQLGQLVAVVGNDNNGTKSGSRVTFTALAGETYALALSGKDPVDATRAGNFTLAWYPTPPPGFTGAQFSPMSGVPGARVTFTGANFTGATAVLFNGASSAFSNALTNNLDLRITANVPPQATSGPVTIVTPHGNVTSTASFQVLPPPLRITSGSASQLVVSWAGTSPEFLL